jgi:hypothetical protein
MTVAEAAGNPHGRVFYSLQVLVTSVFGVGFAVGTFTTDVALLPWRFGRAVLAAVFLFGALQGFERLVRPKVAQARSRALPASTRGTLNVTCKVIQGLSLIFLAGALMMRVSGKRDLSIDLMELWAVLLFLRHCLADLAGDPGTPFSQIR